MGTPTPSQMDPIEVIDYGADGPESIDIPIRRTQLQMLESGFQKRLMRAKLAFHIRWHRTYKVGIHRRHIACCSKALATMVE